MSDDEPEFDGPEDEISNDEAEEEERQAWNEIAEQAHENEEHMSEIAEKEFGGTDNSTEPSEELDLISKIIQEKSNLLNDDSLTPDQKDLIQQELFTLRILERKVVGEPEEKIEYDRDFNAYRFARAASILSLESSWKEIELKMNLLVQKITKTSLEYDKIIALKSVLETFEKDYINLFIDY